LALSDRGLTTLAEAPSLFYFLMALPLLVLLLLLFLLLYCCPFFFRGHCLQTALRCAVSLAFDGNGGDD